MCPIETVDPHCEFYKHRKRISAIVPKKAEKRIWKAAESLEDRQKILSEYQQKTTRRLPEGSSV